MRPSTLRNKILIVAIDCFFLILGGNGDQNIASQPLLPSVQPIPADQVEVRGGNTCPELSMVQDIDILTQDEFITTLTDVCRYDKLVKPPTDDGPVSVDMQIDMRHIEAADHLQFKTHILIQLEYNDCRLNYSKISPNRGNILGEESLRHKIWVPHIIIHNEKESSLMGLDGKDIFVLIDPNGGIKYAYRMTATFYCWMKLQKFPFDHQICQLQWIGWAYNATNLLLKWKKEQPFTVGENLHLTEFILDDVWVEETIEPASFNSGGLYGNYSTLFLKFKLTREVGFYILDYFLPSMLLVCMSWVTFWLQADASAPRATLGTATMLSFITLNGGLSENLPKVSYVKASEIWFFGCSTFIFCSMAEFAFVNVIWRRRKRVEMKKQSSKHILKGALTPSLARKQLRRAESANSLYKTKFCSIMDAEENARNTQANYLTLHSLASTVSIPAIIHTEDDFIDREEKVTTIPIPENGSRSPTPPPWTTMSPQEVANWIDRKSRIAFPVAFMVFNVFYWSFVYVL